MVSGKRPVASQRLFFALVPDRLTCEKIERLHQELSLERHIRGRAIPPSQYHVTLAFLGNQAIDRLPRLLAVAAGLDMPACTVALDCLGSFRRSGVGWLGVSKPPPELLAFQTRLVAALEQAQIALDHRPWQLHLTLYRDLRTPLGKIVFDTVSWHLESFSLVESISIKQGVEYRPLGRWKAGLAGIEQRDV